MTSMDSAPLFCQTETHLHQQPSRVFSCKTVSLSEEDEAQTPSTESPDSKISWASPRLPENEKPEASLTDCEPDCASQKLPEETTVHRAAPRANSQCSGLTAVSEDRLDETPAGDVTVGPAPVSCAEMQGNCEVAEGDFGEFEEAAASSVESEDEFGDFDEAPVTPLPGPSAHSNFVTSFLKLRGMDYFSAASNLFRMISTEQPQIAGVGVLKKWTRSKLQPSSESRLGTQLLFPRSIPAGFLRTTGSPVLVSSKIMSAEHRLLARMGLHELYTQTHKPYSAVQPSSEDESLSAPSMEGSHSRQSFSEMLSTPVDDMSLDLDFLVQFSGSQISGSVDGGRDDGISREEIGRPSQLRELFEGLVDSSQSSFSQSTSPSETKPEVAAPEPCISEQEWDDFVAAPPNPQEIKEMPSEDSDDLSTAQVKEEETDIFSGEWLDQLRSSHLRREVDPACSQAEASGIAETEWGTFTEAPQPSQQDPFQLLMSAISDKKLVSGNQNRPPMGHQQAVVPREAKVLDLTLLEGLGSQSAVHTKGEGALLGGIVASGGVEDEDEWGGFQG